MLVSVNDSKRKCSTHLSRHKLQISSVISLLLQQVSHIRLLRQQKRKCLRKDLQRIATTAHGPFFFYLADLSRANCILASLQQFCCLSLAGVWNHCETNLGKCGKIAGNLPMNYSKKTVGRSFIWHFWQNAPLWFFLCSFQCLFLVSIWREC